MPGRIKLLIVCILLTLPSASAQGKGQGVDVRASRSKVIQVKPKHIFNAPFRVFNKSGKKRELLEQLDIPEGWRHIASELSFVMEPGDFELRLASVYVPITALAGKYKLVYTIRDPRDRSVIDKEEIQVNVTPVVKLEYVADEVPERVIAGRSYIVKFKVVSSSNVPAEVKVTLTSAYGLAATADATRFKLDPGGSKLITVKVKTTEDIEKKIRHQLNIDASTDAGGGASFSKNIQVDVIPRVTGKLNRYRRIPAEFEVVYGHEENEQNVSFQVAGGGLFGKEETHEVDFIFRRPMDTDNTLFGFEEEYRISYWSGQKELHIGDQGYGLSPLTELYRFGRGVEVGAGWKDYLVNGYFMETHLEDPETKQVGTSATYSASELLDLKLNFLKKKSGFRRRPPEPTGRCSS